ncbi:MAG: hypothetical protein RLZZ557_2048, partial [Bacteroidota bacterium]
MKQFLIACSCFLLLGVQSCSDKNQNVSIRINLKNLPTAQAVYLDVIDLEEKPLTLDT